MEALRVASLSQHVHLAASHYYVHARRPCHLTYSQSPIGHRKPADIRSALVYSSNFYLRQLQVFERIAMAAQAPAKIDRQTTTPFLLRLFFKQGSFYRSAVFPHPSLQLTLTWPG